MWPAGRGADHVSADDDNHNSSTPAVSEEVKKNLLLVLKTQHRGMNLDSLVTCYRDKIGKKLEYGRHGFHSLLHMLEAVQEIR